MVKRQEAWIGELACWVMHREQVGVRDAQGLGHAGGDEVLPYHDALVGVDIAVAAAQRRALRQPCAEGGMLCQVNIELDAKG